MANEVRLTFAGDASQLEKTFDTVGSSAKDMADKVGAASKSMEESADGWEKATENADKIDTRAMGFRDTITGVQDSITGLSAILKGDFSADALFTAGAGVGDLASGFANFLLPQLKSTVTWLGNTRVGMALVTAAQYAWNLAMSLNPIGLIIAAIALLVGAFVLLWNKSEAFRDFWKAVWEGIKTAAQAVGDWFVNTLWHGVLEKAFNWIGDAIGNVRDWFKELPGKIGEFFSGLKDKITAPFKAAFNFVADAWNNTIGKLSWTVPSWVPFIGGNTISAPKLPKFHTGGVVPGIIGQEVLAVLQAGERVLPVSAPPPQPATSTGDTIINVTVSLEDLAQLRDLEDFLAMLRNNSRRGLVVAG